MFTPITPRDHCRDIILGSLLGDGSLKIHASYKNARFSFRHSINQKDYFWWKVKQLETISSNHCVWAQKPSGFGGNKLRYQSRVLEYLTKLYRLTHENDVLQMNQTWLQLLSPLSLAVWWLDDGSLIVNTRKGVFCTDGFTKQNVAALARHLNKTWNIQTHVVENRPKQYRLRIYSTFELKKFLRIILPYIPIAAMLSKVLLLYKDPLPQQRWISEICSLTSFSKQEVSMSLQKKRQKWAIFRE